MSFSASRKSIIPQRRQQQQQQEQQQLPRRDEELYESDDESDDELMYTERELDGWREEYREAERKRAQLQEDMEHTNYAYHEEQGQHRALQQEHEELQQQHQELLAATQRRRDWLVQQGMIDLGFTTFISSRPAYQ